MSKKKKILAIAVVAAFILVGIGIMCYPLISNWYEATHHGEVIRTYQKDVEELTGSEMQKELDAAIEYNDQLHKLVSKEDPFSGEFVGQNESYEDLLNVNQDGVMGYIEIPKISVYLPIYHGTSAEVLSRGVGHLMNTSLPVGGLSTHCVISAHRGDAAATLFTNLDQLEVGDKFFLYTLDSKLGYEVDQIKVVLPYETDDFRIADGEDYVTLVTCTPYGINSHRLLVRGTRVAIDPEDEELAEETANMKSPINYWPYILGFGVLAILGVVLFLLSRRGSRQ